MQNIAFSEYISVAVVNLEICLNNDIVTDLSKQKYRNATLFGYLVK